MTGTSTGTEEQAEPRETEAEREPWPSRVALAWLCAVFLVGALVLAGVATSLSSRLADERAEREDATRVAARMGSALLTYDHRDLEATRRAVLSMATESFEQEYEEVFGGLQALYQQTQSTSRATDVEVFLSEIDGGQASAVVRIVAQASGIAGARSQVAVVRLELVEVEDRGWLVENVATIDFVSGQPGGGAAPPAPPPGE